MGRCFLVILSAALAGPVPGAALTRSSCGAMADCLPEDVESTGSAYWAAMQGVDRAVTPDDDLYEQYQWNLRRLGLPQAWALTTGSPSVIVAILDTGVSSTHPDLARKLVALEQKHATHDAQIKAIFDAIRALMEPPPVPPRRPIGFLPRQKR